MTKKSQCILNARERIFNNILKSDYSDSSLLLYKNYLLAECFKKKESVDLGNNLRNLLSALALKGVYKDFYIISTVEGKGFFSLCNTAFEISYCELLINAVKLAYDKKVYNLAKLGKNSLLIKIEYKGDLLPQIKKGVLVKQKNGLTEIVFKIKLKPISSGKSFDFKEYYGFENVGRVVLFEE